MSKVTFTVNQVAPAKLPREALLDPRALVAKHASAKEPTADEMEDPRSAMTRGVLGQQPTAKSGGPSLLDAGSISPNLGDGKLMAVASSGPRDIQHGFVHAVVLAFSEHIPLVLKPAHFMLLVTQAVAEHVTGNAEELRGKFVSHDGQKTLIVQRDAFVLDPAAKNDWAGVVGEFREQIANSTAAGVIDQLVPKFSNNTPVDTVALEICAMSALSKYFAYEVHTLCGFPSITLEGTPEDWDLLVSSAMSLVSERCTPAFAKRWIPCLESVLPRIAATARKQAAAGGDERQQQQQLSAEEVQFWQSFAKRGGIRGSGGYGWIRGWVLCFFPQSEFCVPFDPEGALAKENGQEKYFSFEAGPVMGPDDRGWKSSKFPTGRVSAPVKWKYLTEEFPLSFNAGFYTCVDQAQGAIRPEIGWYIQKV